MIGRVSLPLAFFGLLPRLLHGSACQSPGVFPTHVMQETYHNETPRLAPKLGGNPTNRGNKSAKFRNPTNQQNKSAKSAKFGCRFGGWVVSGAAVSRISRPRWHIEFPVRFPGKNRKIGEMGKDRGKWGEIGGNGETTGVDGGGLCWRSEKWGKLVSPLSCPHHAFCVLILCD